jgi:hypothetical protein
MPKRQKQKAGAVTLPMEYFNPKYTGNYNLTNNTTKHTSAYGPIVARSGMLTMPGGDAQHASPNLAAYPKSTNLQTGGGHPYNYIRNPDTGRNVNIFGKTGKRVLKNYLKSFG